MTAERTVETQWGWKTGQGYCWRAATPREIAQEQQRRDSDATPAASKEAPDVQP